LGGYFFVEMTAVATFPSGLMASQICFALRIEAWSFGLISLSAERQSMYAIAVGAAIDATDTKINRSVGI
jgi:hypothetical protein